jgi:hypothetical protein
MKRSGVRCPSGRRFRGRSRWERGRGRKEMLG